VPYAIKKRGKKYVVLNTRSGQVKGTHGDKKKAQKHMQVLYLIEEEGDGKLRRKRKKRRNQ
jgi:hypothetical protein|tara:strand:+ start:155 stop:337 length:183 start_codon:yes stop_codon:yes gene_type:complete